jgi:hypothetical protein
LRYLARHKGRLNRGGSLSIREFLCVGGPVVHPNAIQDINAAIALLQHTFTTGLKRYLENCKIDTSVVDDEVRGVTNNYRNKIGQLHAKNVVVGKGHAGDRTEQTGQPSDPAQSKE